MALDWGPRMIGGMRVRRRSSALRKTAFRYYRLYITAGHMSGNLRVAELNLVTAENPGGVPSGGTASASSQSHPTSGGDAAFDNNPATQWIVVSGAYPQWVE